jgi:hypothetical protein
MSRDATRDGLLPDSRLAAAISDVAASAARIRAPRDDGPVDPVHTFLAEFSPFCDSHDLLPLDVTSSDASSVPDLVAAIADGSLEPDLEDEPKWHEALQSPEREYWIAGGHDEVRSLQDLKVFVLVPRSEVPCGARPLKGKLVCKRKRDDTGKVVRYKVRYVAKGYAQQYGINYDKTTAPTARLESFRAIAHLAASLDWDLKQYDIKTAFLHGVLPPDESMFMEQPPGFECPGKEDWVWQLLKSIYGMKQASRVWNKTLHAAVSEWGFQRMDCEWCVYIRRSPTGTVIFSVHVDDIFSAASSLEENDRFRDLLKSRWDISELGPAKFALGIAISRDRPSRTISLSQSAFIDRVIERFGQTDAHPCDTPMVAGLQLRRPDPAIPPSSEVSDWMERTPYRALVGSLNYIAVATRPDIAFAVGRLAAFLDCYRPEHWSAGIRVLRYLKGTRSLCLTLGGTNSIRLIGYSDSDYANCVDTSRSIGGYCFSLGSGVISWSSKKQHVVADSSCYAEYIALHEASHETTFLRQLLDGLGFLPEGPSPLHCDNDAASRLAEDQTGHPSVKHIRVKFHSVRQLVEEGDIKITRVRSADNTADILTKPLGRSDFLRLRQYLGIRPRH